ncbi:hypothetical protein Tsubulata_023591, partial [Turnera subulata]
RLHNCFGYGGTKMASFWGRLGDTPVGSSFVERGPHKPRKFREMDRRRTTNDLSIPARVQTSAAEPRQRPEMEVKDPVVAARKVQKADREKLRRDNLNEQPKNDKATILTDTIQLLKDLTAEVNRLKAEYGALSEESREEKNELREEKASLKSDIENLNVQYQQRVRVMYPWNTGADSSIVMHPPFSYPMPVPVPAGPMPMHTPLQPFIFFGDQNAGAVPTPCSTFLPYPTPANPPNDHPSSLHASTSHVSSKQDSKSKSTKDRQRGDDEERCDDGSSDVATELELKMPGSSGRKDMTKGERKGKQCHRKEKNIVNGSSSTRVSSSQDHGTSSSSVGDVTK